MTDYPQIRTVGLSGLLVTFAGAMSEPANRAALAFRAAVDAENWPEVRETSTSLVSTFLDIDLAATPPEAMKERLSDLLKSCDWLAAPLPAGRTLWHVPTLYGTDLAPQLQEAAEVITPLMIFIGCWQLPMYLTPMLLPRLYRWALHDE